MAPTQALEAPSDSTQASPSTTSTVVMLPSDGAQTVGAPSSNQPPAPEVTAEALPAKAPPVEPSSLPADSGLVLIGKFESWVQVKNTTGQLVFNQLVKPGDRHVLKIEGTMNVVIGFADGVQVQLRGKSFDLTPVSKGTVARFEVK
jgi:cytoskeleton protein RodZ